LPGARPLIDYAVEAFELLIFEVPNFSAVSRFFDLGIFIMFKMKIPAQALCKALPIDNRDTLSHGGRSKQDSYDCRTDPACRGFNAPGHRTAPL